jgi:hypothetical protein
VGWGEPGLQHRQIMHCGNSLSCYLYVYCIMCMGLVRFRASARPRACTLGVAQSGSGARCLGQSGQSAGERSARAPWRALGTVRVRGVCRVTDCVYDCCVLTLFKTSKTKEIKKVTQHATSIIVIDSESCLATRQEAAAVAAAARVPRQTPAAGGPMI